MRIELDCISYEAKGTSILRSVSLDVASGAFVSVLGASGAGKSTLLGVVAGLLDHTGGGLRFDGRAVDGVPAHRRNVAVVFQDARLFPNMDALDNVAFPLAARGVAKAERRERAAAMLARVQLGGFERRRVGELSGGQRQRVALARALVAEPGAVLLDEPLSALDETLRDDMRLLILELHERTGTTMLMVTHDPMEALVMSDRVVYLAEGAVVAQGTPAELLTSPDPRVSASFGALEALGGTVGADVFARGKLVVPAPGVSEGPAALLRTADGAVRVFSLDA